MSGSLAAVLGPACLRFFRPMRVVGGGGGSYLGLSFWRRIDLAGELTLSSGCNQNTYLLILVVSSISTGTSANIGLLVTLLSNMH